LDFLLSTKPPYFHYLADSDSNVCDFMLKLSRTENKSWQTRSIRGAKMQTTADLFDEVSAALQFPYYFGENWSALDECIQDLSWLPAEAYVLFISKPGLILEKEDRDDLKSFLKILDEAAGNWSVPIVDNVAWARPAIPFHVIFHDEEPAILSVSARINEILTEIRGTPYKIDWLTLANP
jgi:hypothetical protein